MKSGQLKALKWQKLNDIFLPLLSLPSPSFQRTSYFQTSPRVHFALHCGFLPHCVPMHSSTWHGRHIHVHTHTHTHMAAAPLQKELGYTGGDLKEDIRTCHEAQQQLTGDRCGWGGSREELTSLHPTTQVMMLGNPQHQGGWLLLHPSVSLPTFPKHRSCVS